MILPGGSMHLFNTLTRRKGPFFPSDGPVKLYVCGITPYDTTHLGHLFTYSTFDVLIRYLEYRGHSVSYAQNVTDIDDDILRKASEIGEDWRELGNRWTVHFIEDNQALNLRPPLFFPRATEVIEDIVNAVVSLIAAGVAYESNGSVYFHIDADGDYGKLSQYNRNEMLPIANERGNFPDDPNKKDPLDFVLWQAGSPGEPSWMSPWGSGRPGWHIECSTLSAKFLGRQVDIHGGGADLIFPHHECEIAQAECVDGDQPFTRIWMHVAMLRYQGEKMSKSLGNLVMVRDLLQSGWKADAIRLVTAGHHYREEWEYEESDLKAASALSMKFIQAVTAQSGSGNPVDASGTVMAFRGAMNDDLDTPGAVSVLDSLAREILDSNGSREVADAQDILRELCGILGLRLDAGSPEEVVIEGWDEHKKRFPV
jgi:L-cysteine:1D-myo-inositol 2-amino-2-deoxy-alpha-D-glucopyranoside ligase